MKKIKTFLSKNKEENKVIAYGVAMVIFGIYIGVKAERGSMDNMAARMANNGKPAYKIIGNELYKMTVIKNQFE